MATKKSIGIKDLMERKYVPGVLPEIWMDHLGHTLTKKFQMTVTGDSSQGKTMYVMLLMKVIAEHLGRVSYNSVEQGFSKTLQNNVMLADLTSLAGKVQFHDHLSFDQMKEKLLNKHFRCNYWITDSQDFMEYTFKQYKEIKEMPKRKHLSQITICQSDGGPKPKSTDGKAIRFDADLKVHVKDFVAYNRGRFGETKPFIIWKEGHIKAMKEQGIISPVYGELQNNLFSN